MTSNNVVFLTTIFPLAADVALDYFNSLEKQTFKEFDVLFVDDGFTDLEYFRKRFNSLNIITIEAADSIAKNREILIKAALERQYEYAIFGDFDDYFDSNRIELSLNCLQLTDIVINDLTSFDGVGSYQENLIGKRFKNGQHVILADVLDKNIFGLSNTAMRLSCVHELDFTFDHELIAVDWYFFTLLLLKGSTAQFTTKTVTYYRQHDGNTVGWNAVSEASIKLAIRAKLAHYSCLLQYSDIFQSCRKEVERVDLEVKDQNLLNKLISKNIKNNKSPLWWEIIE